MTMHRQTSEVTKDKRRDERGMALILTLSMLAILSLLGAFALSTTNTELGVTTNFRTGRESFAASERILEYSKALVVDTAAGDTITLSGSQHETNIEGFWFPNSVVDGVDNNEIRMLEAGSGPEVYYGKKDAGDVLGIYFRVSAEGQSRTTRSKSRLESTFFAVTKVGTNDDGNLND